jgi:hypothetical protein
MLVLDVLGDSITTLKRMCNLTLLAPQPNLAVTRFWPDLLQKVSQSENIKIGPWEKRGVRS